MAGWICGQGLRESRGLRTAAEKPVSTRISEFCLCDSIVKIAGSVQDANHVDPILAWRVEDEIVFEAFDWKAAKVCQNGHARVVQNATLRMFYQLETGCIQGGEAMPGKLHTGPVRRSRRTVRANRVELVAVG